MNSKKIAQILASDPNVNASSIVIEEHQIIFYSSGDPNTDLPPSWNTQTLIEKQGGSVHMNDCPGCLNEGVVWPISED